MIAPGARLAAARTSDVAATPISAHRPSPSLRTPRAATAASIVAVVIAIVGARSGARSQATEWDDALATSLSGTWVLDVTPDSARASVEAGIAAATADLPPLVDVLAARELRARLPVSPTVTLSVTRARIEARFAHATFDTVPGLPSTIPTPGDPSTTMEVVQLLRGGRLEEIFTTDGGRRWSTFTPSTDGARLTLDAVIHSERLPTDVRFRIPYRRAG